MSDQKAEKSVCTDPRFPKVVCAGCERVFCQDPGLGSLPSQVRYVGDGHRDHVCSLPWILRGDSMEGSKPGWNMFQSECIGCRAFSTAPLHLLPRWWSFTQHACSKRVFGGVKFGCVHLWPKDGKRARKCLAKALHRVK